MIINPQVQIFATSDMSIVDNAARSGFKLIYIGDQMEIPQGYNFINMPQLTPDYKTICAAISGDDNALTQSYFESLTTPQVEETIAVLLGALTRGVNIVLYFPMDTLQLKYPYLFLQFLMEKFGIKVGDKNTPPIYNPAFDQIILRMLYIYKIIPWNEYIMNTDTLDPISLIRLREDLCGQYNIPTNISDQDMVNKVQQIKDEIVAKMTTKPKLFECVEVKKKESKPVAASQTRKPKPTNKRNNKRGK